MSSLQDQADAMNQDPSEADIEVQRAYEDAMDDHEDEALFADDGADEYPAPEPLESDRGQSQPVSDIHAQPDEPTQDDGFSNELLARARNYGLDPLTIQNHYGSAQQLEDALLAADQQRLNQFQMWQQQQRMQQQRAQPMQPQQQPRQTPAEQQQAIEAYQLQNPERYDEDLAADMNGIVGYADQRFQQAQQEIQQMRQLVEQQQLMLQQFTQAQQMEAQRREWEAFNNDIQGLGPDWEEVFGKGSYDALPQNSPERINRDRAYQTAAQLRWLHQQEGRRMSLKDVLPNSLSHNFPQRLRAAGQNQQPRDNRGRFAARPTRRQNSKEGTKRESALKKWDSIYSQAGMPPDTAPIDGFDY